MSDRRQKFLARVAQVDALRWAAFWVAVGFAGMVTFFVAGYALTDPGGWVAFAGTVACLAAIVGASVLAWYRPDGALVVLAISALAPLAFGLWSLLDYTEAHGWEDSHGPVSLVMVVAVCAPAAVAGLFRPRAAGRLILAVSLVPLALEALGATTRFYEPLSVGLVLAPLIVSGGLFLLAGRKHRRPESTPPSPNVPVAR